MSSSTTTRLGPDPLSSGDGTRTAIFDLDRTLLPGSSLVPLGRALVRDGVLRPSDLARRRRRRGKLVSQRHLLQAVWGPQYQVETNYLRVYMAKVRSKLEPEPSRARYFITEPGVGYRFQSDGT